MSITTNNHVRDLVSYSDLPITVRLEQFDYLSELTEESDDPYTPRFFEYHAYWYDAHEFVRIERRSDPLRGHFTHTVDDDSPLLKWEGIQTDSAFSAIVIRWGTDWDGMTDYDTVVVGSYYAGGE